MLSVAISGIVFVLTFTTLCAVAISGRGEEDED